MPLSATFFFTVPPIPNLLTPGPHTDANLLKPQQEYIASWTIKTANERIPQVQADDR